MDMRTEARLRMMRYPRDVRTLSPVERADQETAMADLRAALCIACGVPLDRIGPLGHDFTDAAYASVRAGWVRHVGQFGRNETLARDDLAEARGYWLESRPDLAAADDWRAVAVAAHLAAYPDGCESALRGGCTLHDETGSAS